jgi:hypothetical protein
VSKRKAKGLNARYHFTFTGRREESLVTIFIHEKMELTVVSPIAWRLSLGAKIVELLQAAVDARRSVTTLCTLLKYSPASQKYNRIDSDQ